MGWGQKGWRHHLYTKCTQTALLLPSNSWLLEMSSKENKGCAKVLNSSWMLSGLSLSHSRLGVSRVLRTYVDGAAEKRAFLQSLLNDLEQVGRRLPQLIPLSNASCEVFKALCGGSA